jgi:hypothetical protein
MVSVSVTSGVNAAIWRNSRREKRIAIASAQKRRIFQSSPSYRPL